MSVRRSKMMLATDSDAAVPRAVEPRRERAPLHRKRRRRRRLPPARQCREASRSGTPASASRPNSTSASSRSSTSSTIPRAIARAASVSASPRCGASSSCSIIRCGCARPSGSGSRFTIEVPIADPARIQSVVRDDRAESAESDRRQAHRRDRRRGVGAPRACRACSRAGAASASPRWTQRKRCASIDGRTRRTSSSPTCVCAAKATASMRSASCAPSCGDSIPAVLISGDTATEQLRKVSAAGLTMMHKPLKAVRLRALLNHEFAKRIA